MGGLSWTTGYDGGPPMRAGIAYADPIAALTAVTALLAAVLHLRETGEGQHVELAQIEALTQLIPEAHMEYALNGRVLGRAGNRDPVCAPQGVLRVRGDDRWVAFSVRHDRDWTALCEALGEPALASDPRFATAPVRRLHHEEAMDVLRAWAAGRDEREVVATIEGAGVPASVVNTNLDVFHDPHLRARGFWVPIEKPAIGRYDFTAGAWRLSGTPARFATPAPELGVHTRAILHELLALDSGELDALEEADVIGTAPINVPRR
jgi:crotonobetainyl-CoA:carnitine CoA-transferase CaiB-like acyl-CoA transferase